MAVKRHAKATFEHLAVAAPLESDRGGDMAALSRFRHVDPQAAWQGTGNALNNLVGPDGLEPSTNGL
jgi:hypothetical protein